jgi:carboxylate-amine ligase
MRRLGVEEEFLLIDAHTGRLMPVGDNLVAAAGARQPLQGPDAHGNRSAPPGTTLTTEVQREQIEAVTAPFTELADLAGAIRAGREEANYRATGSGAKIAAVGTSPLYSPPHLVTSPRYAAIGERFRLTLSEQLMCGLHVHVSIDSPDEGVAVLDRIRVWLPLLIALSGNSPYWQGKDSGYASYRYQVWRRWPTAGPTDIFGSAAAYKDFVELLLSSGVLLDEGMVYFDARLSSKYPTVEIRVPDVCTDVTHTIAISAIIRALVDTAARDWTDGKPAPPVPAELLRLASWRASRYGLADDLIHPGLNRPRPATECIDALLLHAGPALALAGDEAVVDDAVHRILASGTGADRQRTVMASTGSHRKVLLDAADRTLQ